MGDHPKVLLVAEDDPDHAELLLRGLAEEAISHRVLLVHDGEAVLEYLDRRGAYADEDAYPLPDLMLLDLRLPKRDGLEVLAWVKQHARFRRLPVVILTSSAAENDIARAYDFRANSYLVKPLDFGQLRKLARELGIYWTVFNRLPPFPSPVPGNPAGEPPC